MLCERCHKNKATLLMNEYTQGKMKESYLCNECAHIQTNKNFISGILEMALGSYKQNELVCKNCKMSASEFRKSGRFGCPVCYDTFNSILKDALNKIQPGNEHTGKIPKSLASVITIKREIKQLRNQLNEVIEKEEYEEAAKLRDRIKDLEKGGEAHD